MRYLLPLTLALLCGCVRGPQPEFYQLPSPPLPADQPGPAVLLGPLQLADYLQRENLIQRHSAQRLELSQQARWAGSLEDDIGRLLLATLATRLPSDNLALYPDRVGFVADAQLLVQIARLDSGPAQPAVLEARWRLLDAQGRQRGSDLLRLEQAHDGSLEAQVAAQAELLRRLGERLAEAVRAMPAGS
ncbi:MAG: ABC-type transport auxiliary lipoprotein family protein [Pseudomonadaceae bacterium]|mgnify:CR=1 FL=1|nr:ABC-type transport auxiliary lipoprotein family protein [Pseudomonadaceae bacterium]